MEFGINNSDAINASGEPFHLVVTILHVKYFILPKRFSMKALKGGQNIVIEPM